MELLTQPLFAERADRIAEVAEDAWQVYRLLTGNDNFEHFTTAYVGNWSTLATFGEHVIKTTYGGGEQLERLPTWLTGYIRLDGLQAALDFGRAGHYAYVERPDYALHVFNGSEVPIPAEDLRTSHGVVSVMPQPRATTAPPVAHEQGAI